MPTSARREVANSPKIFVKSGMYCRADVGIGPYKRMRKRIRICRRITQNRNTLLQNLSVSASPSHLPFQGNVINLRRFNIS